MRGDEPPEIKIVEVDEDLEDGPRRGEAAGRPGNALGSPTTRRRAGLVVLMLVLAGIAGFLIGRGSADVRRPASGTSASPGGTSSPSATSLTTTRNRCSAQVGRQLQLGVELDNPTGGEIVLREITPAFFVTGLATTRTERGVCGQPADGLATPYLLKPNSTVWIRATVDVLIACPAPVPVFFDVSYTTSAGAVTIQLPAFLDLGGVPYTGCR